ncbi:LysM peptidoglycan-binding domain-containing protein, partial [Aspergillus melleus]|uniref:LysM peptidoglycan-binding domain-containing protein n=1 Tax=Aspergillus melleus TaxID=138277 RepID=UPI001E8CBB03
MIKPSLLPVLFLGLSAAAAFQHEWKNGDSATGFTDPSVVDGCEFWVDIGYDDTCEAIEDYFGITKTQFRTWNPSVPPSCTLTRGSSYCVAGPEDIGSSSSTTAPNPTPAGTLTYSGTAAPTQSGIDSGCSKYYLVRSDDTCYIIQDKFMTFTLEQFYSWNPSISTGCGGLEPSYFVCVGAMSSSIPITSTGPSSAPGHQPQQTGIPST